MSTVRSLVRLALVATALAVGASACYPNVPARVTVVDAGPVNVMIVAYCDRPHGVEVKVTNQEPGTIPITVQHDTEPDGTIDYSAPIDMIVTGDTREWNWPGSRPARVIVRLGDHTGMILVDELVTYADRCPPGTPAV